MEDLTSSNKIEQHKKILMLTISQQNAIELLLAGKSDAEVATAVGVERVTVCQWRNHHPDFRSVLNELRLQMWEASVSRLNTLRSRSIEVIGEAIEKGDTEAALGIIQILKGVVDNQPESAVLNLAALEVIEYKAKYGGNDGLCAKEIAIASVRSR